MQPYSELLNEELQNARLRLCNADKTAKETVRKQIKQIERDIQRNSTKNKD